MLHHSANGVSEGVDWPSPEVAPRFKLGPSQDWVSSVLFAAYWTYGLLFLGFCGASRPSGSRTLPSSWSNGVAVFRSRATSNPKRPDPFRGHRIIWRPNH